MKYFMPRYHHWYMNMVHYPSRYRYYMTLLVLIAFVGFWYGLLYRPFNRAISSYVRKNLTLRNQLQEQAKLQELSSSIAKSITGLERDLRAYQAAPLDANDLITYIVKQAINAHLLVATCITEPVVDHGWYQLQPMVIDVAGPLIAIIQWIKTVSAQTKLLSVSSLSIARVDQSLVRCSTKICCMSVRTIS